METSGGFVFGVLGTIPTTGPSSSSTPAARILRCLKSGSTVWSARRSACWLRQKRRYETDAMSKMILFDYGHTLIYEEEAGTLCGTRALMPYITKNPNHYTAGADCGLCKPAL